MLFSETADPAASGAGSGASGDATGDAAGAGVPGVASRLRASTDRRVIGATLGAGCLDRGEDLPNGVHQPQQRAGDVGSEIELSVAKQREETLSGMAHGLQPGEAEKAAGALDGVDAAKDGGEQLTVAGMLFQRHEVPVESVEPLVALDQELSDDVVHVAHAASGTGTLRMA